MHDCRSISSFQRYFRPLDLDGGFVYAPPRRKTDSFLVAQKQDSILDFDCQLTELADFDYLLDKSRTETDSDDTRADNLTRWRSNKRPKTKSIQKAAERARGRTPKRLSGRLRDRSALDFSFSFGCATGVCLSRRACGAPQNERSEFWGLAGEPTCIRQAHARVPKGGFKNEKAGECTDKSRILLRFVESSLFCGY